MHDMAPEEIDELLAALGPVPELRLQTEAIVLADIVKGSTSDHDARLRFGDCALMYATQYLQVSVDHLSAWRALFSDAKYAPSFAQMTLLRSAIETAARARWLVDAGQAPAERAHRGALCQLESAVEVRKFVETDAGNEMLPRVRIRERALKKVMARHGYAAGRLNSVDIAEKYGLGAWAWRYTSGYAHAREWAITSGTQGEVAYGIRPGQRRVNTSATPRTVIDLTKLTAGLAIQAHNEIVAYAGGYANAPG